MSFPEEFSPLVPIGAMAFTRTVVRNALTELASGTHVPGDPLGSDHRKAYMCDLTMLCKLTDVTKDAYHAPIINETRRTIAAAGW